MLRLTRRGIQTWARVVPRSSAVLPRHAPAGSFQRARLHTTDLEARLDDFLAKEELFQEADPKLTPERTFKRALASPLELQLGDYVEVFRDGQYSGMVIEQKPLSGQLQRLCIMLRNGKPFNCRSDQVAFRVPGFANEPDVTQYLKAPFSFDPKANVMENVPPGYSRAIFNYQRTVRHLKASGMRRLDQMYTHFTPNSSNGLKTVQLEDLARFAFARTQPTPLQLHATFAYVVGESTHYMATLHGCTTGTWMLRSKTEAKQLSQVMDWIRTRDPIYTGFLERAHQLVKFSQEHADPQLGTFSCTALDMATTYAKKLTDSDRVLINFIADWIKTPEVSVSSPHDAVVPTMLKALKCYNETFVNKSVAMTFLKDVGMFKPWDNIGLLEDAAVAQEFFWSDKAKEDDKKMNSFAQAFLGSREETTAAGFYARDPCDAIRHDFGNLPVYTIDDPTAKEIDDGISIERIPGEKYPWLHVHIADPSAHLPPHHELAQIMLQRVQTLYLPESHFPMLPNVLASEKFSLGVSAQMAPNRDGSQYALTFSTRVDEEGNLLDWKVRPSLVKNVKTIYYDDADALLASHTENIVSEDPLLSLGMAFSHPTSTIWPTTSNTAKTTISDASRKDLFDIYNVTKQLARKRCANGAIVFNRPSPVIDINPCPLDLPLVRFDEPSFASSLPALRVSAKSMAYSLSRQMVAESMIAGGRIASLFAQERGVVLPFRAQQWKTQMTTEEKKMRDEMFQARNPTTGTISLQEMTRYLSVLPPATLTTQAGCPHVVMGIRDGYVKATSPLRRYLDIVAHWQLKAHLLNESAPFDVARLQSLMPQIQAREKQLGFLQQRSIQFWVTELLRRLRADSHGEDLVWTVLVNLPNKTVNTNLGASMEVATGTLLELGIRGRLEKLDRTVQVGEVLQARITHLDPLSGQVNLRAM